MVVLAMARCFLLLAIAGAVLARTPQEPVRVVNIQAERFDFSPSRVTVAPGEEIEIHLTSEDTAHGFRVEGTDIDVEIPKRGHGEVVVRFKATKDGSFKFECSRMCGAGHHFMRGQIVVKEKRHAP